MEQTRKVVEVQNNFVKTHNPILMTNKVVNTSTGVIAELNMTDKVVYSHIAQQVAWFTTYGKKMFESQESIANALGSDRKTINRSVMKLEEVGLLVRRKECVDNIWKTIYSIPKLNSGMFVLLATRQYRVRGKPVVKVDVEIIIKDKGIVKKTAPMKYKPLVIEEDDPFECPF